MLSAVSATFPSNKPFVLCQFPLTGGEVLSVVADDPHREGESHIAGLSDQWKDAQTNLTQGYGSNQWCKSCVPVPFHIQEWR